MPTLGQQLRSAASRYQQPARWASLRQPRLSRLSHNGRQGSQPTIAKHARRQRVEAVLFLAREPLTLRRLAQMANLADATEARTLLRELQTTYQKRRSAMQIEQLAGGYQLLTRAALAPWVEKFVAPCDDLRLSPSAMETLAVVAYRQPVVRAEVEAIRGVGCGELLRQLMQRDLLRIVGRSEELGRPLLYGTTKRFLQAFGLRNLDQLPQAETLRATRTNEATGESTGKTTAQAHVTAPPVVKAA